MQAASQPTGTRSVFNPDGILLGCDYNPEQWPREVWVDDIALMRELGVGIVAINIFGWADINPAKGVYDFDGLDTIIGLLHAAGIRVNLGTGTASAPPWLTTLHPEILPAASDGTTRYPGGRQAWCPSSPVFRAYALELTTRVAERYGQHPAVALWHVSNELGCHNALCYCGTTADAFRAWLEARYETLDALNSAWGTSFWSQRYSGWDQILTPLQTLSFRNPGQVLDFQRFSSEQLLEYYRAEAAVIRERSDAPITTNFMVTAHIRNLDYWRWAPEMDLIANDHYLDHRLGDPIAELAFAADLTRGLAQGEPWMLMETSPGAVNWQPYNPAREPGGLLRAAASHVARGADSICFFQWRASAQGSEKFHSALVPHAGTDSRQWREALELGRLLRSLDGLPGTRTRADAALVFSWESWWAADGDPRPSEAVTYLGQVHAAYRAFRAAGITVDIVAPGADLSGYGLAIIPSLHILDEADADAITRFVDGGGTAFVTFNTGIVDSTDRVHLGGYPGPLREMLGIRVEEFAPVVPGTTLTLSSGSTATLWSERIALAGAEVIDQFVDGPSAAGPAITRHAETGAAWYLATVLDDDAYRSLANRVVADAGLVPEPGAGAEVEVVRRSDTDGTRSFLFVINHSAESAELPAAGRELVTGEAVDGLLTVPAGAVRIIQEVQA